MLPCSLSNVRTLELFKKLAEEMWNWWWLETTEERGTPSSLALWNGALDSSCSGFCHWIEDSVAWSNLQVRWSCPWNITTSAFRKPFMQGTCETAQRTGNLDFPELTWRPHVTPPGLRTNEDISEASLLHAVIATFHLGKGWDKECLWAPPYLYSTEAAMSPKNTNNDKNTH